MSPSEPVVRRVPRARNRGREPMGDKELLAVVSSVTDPEIPVLTIAEMGILRGVWRDGDSVVVEITPTYSGCPALDQIADDIGEALADHGVTAFTINIALAPAWTTDWMNDESKQKLEAYGIAPPCQTLDQSLLTWRVTCPQCRSADTIETSHFGATACKSLWTCRSCREPFEHFKPY